MDHVKLVAVYSINIIGGIFIIGHLIRSVKLNMGLSWDTMKMYLAISFFVILADLALAEVISTEVLTGLLGAVIGGALGSRLNVEGRQ